MVCILNWFKKNKPFTNCYFELCAAHVKDVMVTDVMTVGRYDSLIDAAHIMIGAHISCLVVTDGDKPVGILTERDFIKKFLQEEASKKMLEAHTAALREKAKIEVLLEGAGKE